MLRARSCELRNVPHLPDIGDDHFCLSALSALSASKLCVSASDIDIHSDPTLLGQEEKVSLAQATSRLVASQGSRLSEETRPQSSKRASHCLSKTEIRPYSWELAVRPLQPPGLLLRAVSLAHATLSSRCSSASLLFFFL